MPRKTEPSLKVQKYTNRAIQLSRNALLDDLCEGIYEAYINNGKRLSYGHVTNLLKELKPKEKWLPRNIINKSFMKYRNNNKMIEEKVVPDAISGISTNLLALSVPYFRCLFKISTVINNDE